MTNRKFCDGLQRRDLLKVGLTGLFGSGLSLDGMLRAENIGAAANDRGLSVIYVFLKGGLSTIDTIDMKPSAPAEFRGDFNPGATNVPGLQICDLLPKMALQMDKMALLRGFGHKNSDHGAADHYMLTGYFPQAGFNPSLSPNNQRPSLGSIIAKKLGPQNGSARAASPIPTYVCLPQMHNSAGAAYLGATCAPLSVEADPAAPDFSVPDLVPPLTLSADRLSSRQALLAKVDKYQKSAELEANSRAKTVDVFRQKAFDLIVSPAAKQAFNLHAENDKLRDEYGRNTLGQSCLMSRRLVEAGVRCVTIEHANWDTHDGNFATLKRDLLPQLDPAISTLFRDLSERGMLEKTLVVVSGEFGRTPRINKNAGRDHWGPSFTVILGGGGIQGGRVIGASDERAERPADQPHGPEDLFATMTHLLGIDPQQEFLTQEGRPIKIVNDGKIIRSLL
ncbi:hypothetical protein ETAA8_65730 [Anatilimnocola aggregata]|uniref:DUF1501 domain-containing protein n=1 Tax=Anatilimnocola aggregata TaxID=2528021 RepID=A0A517YMH8_9BACT|nr:DUF1501 domain-containing protein [Anatilimnocola aggregata]QDU31416.1 hypothetical protein ETAA8_65730 [Anatilimnocola aggregata]